LMFVVKAAVAGSFDAERILVTLSFASPILLEEPGFQDMNDDEGYRGRSYPVANMTMSASSSDPLSNTSVRSVK